MKKTRLIRVTMGYELLGMPAENGPHLEMVKQGGSDDLNQSNPGKPAVLAMCLVQVCLDANIVDPHIPSPLINLADFSTSTFGVAQKGA